MAWEEVWSYKIDGTEINTGPFIVQIPELETGSDDDVILVAIDNSAPAYIRNQPKEGLYSILIGMTPCDWATYQTRMDTMRAVLTRGPHTLEAKVRGMTTAKSGTVIVRGWAVAAKERRAVVTCVVPKPLF